MRKLALTLTAAAAFTLGASLTDRAEAGALGGADGIRAALDQIRLAEPVHCRPGRWHHKSRSRPDGCTRRVYRRAPQYYGYYPQPYAYAPYPYGYRQHYYGSPGISFGFSTGRRHSGFGWGF